MLALSLLLAVTATYAPKSPTASPSVDPTTAAPAKSVAGATTLMSNATIAQLANVPEAKLRPGIVLGPDTPIATDASIIFHCATWVQPRFEGTAGHALFRGGNQCGGGYGIVGALVWFKAQTDKDYMVECVGSVQKWNVIENTPSGVGQDTTFPGGTARPVMHIRPKVAGWHGVQISVPSIGANESFTLSKCRITPVAK